jgi:hypothetical protein
LRWRCSTDVPSRAESSVEVCPHRRKRSFERKLDAERFARAVETDILTGDWIDSRRSNEPFAEWAMKWMATLGTRKPTPRSPGRSPTPTNLRLAAADDALAPWMSTLAAHLVGHGADPKKAQAAAAELFCVVEGASCSGARHAPPNRYAGLDAEQWQSSP